MRPGTERFVLLRNGRPVYSANHPPRMIRCLRSLNGQVVDLITTEIYNKGEYNAIYGKRKAKTIN